MRGPTLGPSGHRVAFAWRRVGGLLVTIVLGVALTACGAGTGAAGGDPPPSAWSRVDVAVGAVTLHARVGGAPGGPTVVLLHGFPESGRTWDAVAADLARDHRVVVPDLRGAGDSGFAPPGTDDYTKRSLAADVAGLVERLDTGPVTVVGHDMGAMTAMAWARSRPDQVSRLVLTGGGVPGFGLLRSGPPHLRSFREAPPGELARRLAGQERDFLTRFVLAGAGSAPSPQEAAALQGLVEDAVATYRRPGRLDAAFGQYRALERDAADNRDPRHAPVLPMPVLVVASAPPDLTDDTVAALAPHRHLVVVDGGGHFLPTSRPIRTAAAIRQAARPG